MNQTRHTILYFICFLMLMVTSVCCSAAETTLNTQITGIDGAVLKNVTDRLLVIQESYGKNLNERQIHAFLNSAPPNIQKALQPFGYFKANITAHLSHQGPQWTAYFKIIPGPLLYITQFDLQLSGPGKYNPELQKLVHHFPIAVGQPFRAEAYDKAKEMLFQTANNQGYLKSVLDTKIIRIDLKTYTAAIILHMNTGPCYYFGPITFKQDAFSESFLRRFLSFHEGDPFSSQKLLLFQENLNNSRYFKQIDVTPELNQADHFQIPTNVALTANKAQEYNIAAGYGTFTGPRLTLGTNFRHLTKTGHHLNVQLKLSPVLSGLAAQYIIPGENPLTDQYALGANIQRFLPKNGYSTSETLSASYTKTINDWKNTLTLSYLREHYSISTDPSSHNSRLLIPSLSISRVKADNLINPRFGNKIDFVVRGASADIISNTNFVQSEIKGVYIYSPTQLSRMILRGDLGYTVVNDLTMLPLSLQFFAGGLNSVRGFPTTYFGPGRYLKVGSIELQHRIIDKWNAAVFYDVGTASNHFNTSVGKGVGVGIIYDSLIGPIKLYRGVGHSQNKTTRTYEFSIGTDL